LTEALFADAVEERSVASASLREAAKIASDLFPPASIDLLLNTASQAAFADLCLPIVEGRSPPAPFWHDLNLGSDCSELGTPLAQSVSAKSQHPTDHE
jgi:hypothetical protein